MSYTLNILLLFTLSFYQDLNNTVSKYTYTTKKQPIWMQGAGTLDELGNRLYDALKSGSSDNLIPYLIDKQVYDRLLKQSPGQLRETLELLSPENIATDFQREFRTLVTDGVTAQVNWAQTKVSGVNKKQNVKAPQLIPVTLQLSDQNNTPVEVSFEAVKVDNRFYFFQQVRLGSE